MANERGAPSNPSCLGTCFYLYSSGDSHCTGIMSYGMYGGQQQQQHGYQDQYQHQYQQYDAMTNTLRMTSPIPDAQPLPDYAAPLTLDHIKRGLGALKLTGGWIRLYNAELCRKTRGRLVSVGSGQVWSLGACQPGPQCPWPRPRP